MLEMEALLLDLLMHRAMLPEFGRDPSFAARDELLLKRPLRVLDGELAVRTYLAAEDFTIADLNVASILVWGKMSRLDLSGYPHLAKWLDACLQRPAYARLRTASKRQ